MPQTTLVFLGTAACIPEPGNDTASYLLNGSVLIDVGWHVTETLRRAGRTPQDIRSLFFTHMHHDHMMALAAFLYERYAGGSAAGLRIYGPPPVIGAVEDADRYLRRDRYWPDAGRPEVRALEGGEELLADGIRVRTMPSVHAVPGLCYRMEDTRTGTALGFTGDGIRQAAFPRFFRGCDALMHEYSLGTETAPGHPARHSSIRDAIRTAAEAEVGLLCPVHGPEAQRGECERIARSEYGGKIFWPAPNDRLEFPAGSAR